MLAFKTIAFRRFGHSRHTPFPVDDFPWAILDAGITLDARFRINAELKRSHPHLLFYKQVQPLPVN
jgi:hypothetical protein